MKRMILIGIMLMGMGLAGRALAQTASNAHANAIPPDLFATLSYLFPGLDPFCIRKADQLHRKQKAHKVLRRSSQLRQDSEGKAGQATPAFGEFVEPLGKECFSLNLDLVFHKNNFDGRVVPLAKLKFGF